MFKFLLLVIAETFAESIKIYEIHLYLLLLLQKHLFKALQYEFHLYLLLLLQKHYKDTRNCQEKVNKISHLKPNQLAPSIYIMKELCFFSLDQ